MLRASRPTLPERGTAGYHRSIDFRPALPSWRPDRARTPGAQLAAPACPLQACSQVSPCGQRSVQCCSSASSSASYGDAGHQNPAAYQEFVFAEGPAAAGAVQQKPKWAAILGALFKFTRPHTMFGTFISVTSISLLSAGSVRLDVRALVGYLQAVISALLMNICIVGINQIYDIDIDKINKPYLPLACGELTMRAAALIVGLTGAASLAVGVASASMPLVGTLAGSLLLGIAYSTDLPGLRWKQYPVIAAGCILAVRALLVQFGFYMHMQHVLGSMHYVMSRPAVFAMSFMLLFSVVIAAFKDLPDVEGDSKVPVFLLIGVSHAQLYDDHCHFFVQAAGVRTFSVRSGVYKVFWTCILLLETAYFGGVAVGLQTQVLWSRLVMILAHVGMGALLYRRARRTDLSSNKSVYSCYMFIWKLFYAEYLVIPFLR